MSTHPYYLVAAGRYGPDAATYTYHVWRWHGHDLAAALRTLAAVQQEGYDFVCLSAHQDS